MVTSNSRLEAIRPPHRARPSEPHQEKIGYVRLGPVEEVANPNVVPDSTRFFEAGKNRDGWWEAKDLVEQLENAIQILQIMLPNKTFLFLFDHSSNHQAFPKDALIAHKMNLSPGGMQPKMKPGYVFLNGQKVPQIMVYGVDHPGHPGQPKGLLALLVERGLVDDKQRLLVDGHPVGTRLLKACMEAYRTALPFEAEDPDLATGVLKWCSLFGSNGDDASYSIRIDSQYNITVDGAAGGSWGTNTGVVLPFRGGESDQVMQQYYEYEFPIYTPKPLRSEPSPIGPALTCSGGTLATATTTTTATEETLRPTASSSSGFPTPTQSMSSTSSTSSTKSSASLQSNPAEYLVKLGGICIALLFALFA